MSDLQLVAMFDATTGILRGTALATQQIPVEAEAAADETEADETDPVAILRSNARLAANQVRRSRTGLGQATSESDFETRRVGLIQSVNAAYTAQITLLDALGLIRQQIIRIGLKMPKIQETRHSREPHHQLTPLPKRVSRAKKMPPKLPKTLPMK